MLTIQQSSFYEEETSYSITERHTNIDAEPDWLIKRFTLMMKCDVVTCGELASVAGDKTVWYGEDDEGGYHEHEMFKVLFVNLPPHIIAISDKLPVACKQHLIKAFGLYWHDLGATANRLRIVVERLMDHFNVPKRGKGSKAKVHNLDLSERIDEFEKLKPGHANVFNALRFVGNLGSHEGKGDQTALLTCFELLEHAFSELIDERSAKLDAKALSLIQNKGQYIF